MKLQMYASYLFILAAGIGQSTEWEPPMREIECSIQPIDKSKIHPNANSSTFQTTSPNWSGYVASADCSPTNADGAVTYVQGSWLVPTLMPTADPSTCSIWLGMDGYLNDGVERIGTAHHWINGQQENHIWLEVSPQGYVEVVNFPINTGDRMSAKVGYKGGDTFKFIISNITQGVSYTIPASYTMSTTALRSSAEWIVEAADNMLLADFDFVSFNYCTAIINGEKGYIDHEGWMNEEITMTGPNGVKAQPSVLLKEGTCFQVIPMP